jgi:hypothetical protein
LNGRRTAPIFRQGIFNDEIKWCDYTAYYVDQYKAVTTWPQAAGINGLNDLWQAFSDIWKNKDSRDFIILAIHWYVEANSTAAFADGSIVMTQIALELIYNWLIIESKKMLIGKDSENISAANKIRLLLSQLNIDYSIPEHFTNLQSFAKTKSDGIDGPESFVRIRNAIIHSQEEKRKEIITLHHMVKYEALQLGIWYIELALLYIFKFQGKYYNRCLGAQWAGAGEVDVPWKGIVR